MYVCVRVYACVCVSEEDVHEKGKKKEKRKQELIHTNKQTDERTDGQIDTKHSMI